MMKVHININYSKRKSGIKIFLYSDFQLISYHLFSRCSGEISLYDIVSLFPPVEQKDTVTLNSDFFLGYPKKPGV